VFCINIKVQIRVLSKGTPTAVTNIPSPCNSATFIYRITATCFICYWYFIHVHPSGKSDRQHRVTAVLIALHTSFTWRWMKLYWKLEFLPCKNKRIVYTDDLCKQLDKLLYIIHYKTTTLTTEACIETEIKSRLSSGNRCYHSLKILSSLLKIHKPEE
jgi:hypothetical protein